MMPRDIPITFSGPMVRALLDGRKTMARRLAYRGGNSADGCGFIPSPWANVKPLDRLWVRENFSGPYDYRVIRPGQWCPGIPVWYWADGNPSDGDWTKNNPSIFMPRWASRLTLVVTATKIERLQAITAVDAFSEGFPPIPGHAGAGASAQEWFSALWSGLHGVESWRDNPEVVALSFRVIRANIDAPEALVA